MDKRYYSAPSLGSFLDSHLDLRVTNVGGFGQTGESWAVRSWYVSSSGSWRSETRQNGVLSVWDFKKLNYDYGDGTQGVGVFAHFWFHPSEEQRKLYSEFNLIVITNPNQENYLGPSDDLIHQGPFYYDKENYDRWSGYDHTSYAGTFLSIVNKESIVSFSG